MCSADISPVRHKWFPTAKVFGPDFSTQHTCRNFEMILEWSKARSSPEVPGKEVAMDENLVLTTDRHYVSEKVHNHRI